MQLGEGELRGPIHCHVQVELAFFCAELGDVDMEVANRIALEGLLGGLVAGDLGQAADPVTLQAPMQ
jgi:hypothetical protein